MTMIEVVLLFFHREIDKPFPMGQFLLQSFVLLLGILQRFSTRSIH